MLTIEKEIKEINLATFLKMTGGSVTLKEILKFRRN
jgi:hypothetical protein